MSNGYSRGDLQAHALRKLEDARTLLAEHSPSNAYYLTGYVVELGLKACIARNIVAETVPAKEVLKGFLEHNYIKLVGLAGLTGELRSEQDADPTFSAYWALVMEWSPDARYEAQDTMSAQTMLQAVDDPDSGVLTWIRKHW